MLKNISSNWSLNILQILVFMALTPFAAQALGRESYGVWEIIVSSAGPLQLLALGLPMATVRAVSRARSDGDPEAASRAVGTAFTMTLMLGAIAAVLGISVYGAFSTFLVESDSWAGLAPERAEDAKLALMIMLAHVSAGFALALPYAIYDAHQDFIARNLIMGGGMLLKLAATVILLTMRAELATLAVIQLGIAGLEFTVALTLSRRRHPGVRLAPTRVAWTEARALLSFSVFAFLLNMGALLAFRLDALVIGANMPPEQAAIYGFGNKIFDPFINLLLAIGMVLMPMAATESRRGNLDVVRDAFLKWSKIAATIVCLIGGYLMVLGPAFLDMWLGDEYVAESGRLLQLLMVSFFLFLPVRGVALPVLMGLGKAKWPGLGLLAMGFCNLALSVVLIGPYGLIGVALGTAIPNVIFSTGFAYAACRALDLSFLDWLDYAFGRTGVAAVASGGALYLASQSVSISGFWPLVAAGLAYCSAFGALVLLYVYSGDRFIDLRARLPMLSARGSS